MSFFSNFKGSYQDIWKAIIRPSRHLYTPKELGKRSFLRRFIEICASCFFILSFIIFVLILLGPKDFLIKDDVFRRRDFKLKNKHGFILECSHFEPFNRPSKQLPCVIYLHGNSSSRTEAFAAAEILLPLNISVFCFDFAGCGHSQGEYISLGWYEREDVEVVIEHLNATGSVSKIGIWGRSMGAVTALLYAES